MARTNKKRVFVRSLWAFAFAVPIFAGQFTAQSTALASGADRPRSRPPVEDREPTAGLGERPALRGFLENPLLDADGYQDIPRIKRVLDDYNANHFALNFQSNKGARPNEWNERVDAYLEALAPVETHIYSTGFNLASRRPYLKDYLAWARAIAELSQRHPNLTGWVLDDFFAESTEDPNKNFLDVTYLRAICAAKSASPRLRLHATVYCGWPAGEAARRHASKYSDADTQDGIFADLLARHPDLADCFDGVYLFTHPKTLAASRDLERTQNQCIQTLRLGKPTLKIHLGLYLANLAKHVVSYELREQQISVASRLPIDGAVSWVLPNAETTHPSFVADVDPRTKHLRPEYRNVLDRLRAYFRGE